MKRTLLSAFFLLLLLCTAGCGAKGEQEATELTFDHSLQLDYAQQFSVDYYDGGYAMVNIQDIGRYLVVPENAAVPGTLPDDVTVLQQPLENIYLVSTSVMDLFCKLDALDTVSLSGTRADGWYIDEAKAAMEEGKISYAGKYSAPDYEQILAANCRLAIENMMISHTPEVREELELLGIPVLVERSSYERSPLARMEWIKLYGVLLGKEELAEQIFSEKAAQVTPLLEKENTGKTVAFFSITSNHLVTVRKGGDYVAQMIDMAGGNYVFSDLADNGNDLSTMNLPLETFYAEAKDADVLIYNSTIEGSVTSMDELLSQWPLLADFKAVQNGDVWCLGQNLFQHSMELCDLIVDMNAVFEQGQPDDATLNYLTHID